MPESVVSYPIEPAHFKKLHKAFIEIEQNVLTAAAQANLRVQNIAITHAEGRPEFITGFEITLSEFEPKRAPQADLLPLQSRVTGALDSARQAIVNKERTPEARQKKAEELRDAATRMQIDGDEYTARDLDTNHPEALRASAIQSNPRMSVAYIDIERGRIATEAVKGLLPDEIGDEMRRTFRDKPIGPLEKQLNIAQTKEFIALLLLAAQRAQTILDGPFYRTDEAEGRNMQSQG
ncbi:hypothetical protein S4A8_02753 [Salinisphaera sp. S4-8]|uniref:hypothetical protein n=1 Tax=Salinisphaera sp. S4-8 TaxID=633357 RepID=UPI003342DD88